MLPFSSTFRARYCINNYVQIKYIFKVKVKVRTYLIFLVREKCLIKNREKSGNFVLIHYGYHDPISINNFIHSFTRKKISASNKPIVFLIQKSI